MNQFSFFLEQVGIVLEQDALPNLLKRISIDRHSTIEQFELADLAYRDQSTHRFPVQSELNHSAEIIVSWAQRKSFMVGGLGGFGGFVTVFPEQAAYLIQLYRLTQRLMILYDLNHKDDDVIAKALIFAHRIESDPNQSWLLSQAKKSAPGLIRSVMLKNGKKIVGKRMAHFLPGIGAGMGALSSYRTIASVGKKINLFFAQMELGNHSENDIEEAIEI